MMQFAFGDGHNRRGPVDDSARRYAVMRSATVHAVLDTLVRQHPVPRLKTEV